VFLVIYITSVINLQGLVVLDMPLDTANALSQDTLAFNQQCSLSVWKTQTLWCFWVACHYKTHQLWT